MCDVQKLYKHQIEVNLEIYVFKLRGTRLIMIRKTTALFSALALTGCMTPYGEAPVARNFPANSQEKLQAASHWGIISNNLSNKIQASMNGKVDKSQPLYVSAKTTSAFNQAVVAELIASLVDNNYNVVNNVSSATNALKLDVDTQVLAFSANRKQPRLVGVPTAIATGIWALTEVGTTFTGAGVATGALAAVEAGNYFSSENATGATPKTEIIINVSVADSTHYLAVARGTYYVADTDKELYKSAIAVENRSFNVRGSNQ